MKRWHKIALTALIALCMAISLAAVCSTAATTPHVFAAKYRPRIVVTMASGDHKTYAFDTVVSDNAEIETYDSSTGTSLRLSVNNGYVEFRSMNTSSATAVASIEVQYDNVPIHDGDSEGLFQTLVGAPYDMVTTGLQGIIYTYEPYMQAGTVEIGWRYQPHSYTNNVANVQTDLMNKNAAGEFDNSPLTFAGKVVCTYSSSTTQSLYTWGVRFAAEAYAGDYAAPAGMAALSVNQGTYDRSFTVEYVSGGGVTAFPSVAQFLDDTVGEFFNFHITPAWTIAAIFGVLLTVLIVLAYLKVFAGG